jgi:hypothetical protein
MRNIKKMMRAISVAAAAMPVKPKKPAIIAITKKINTHRNIPKTSLLIHRAKSL